jgi:hypothetical protein
MNLQNSDCISALVSRCTDLLTARAELKRLRERAGILTGGGTFPADDFAGANAALTPADFTNLAAALDTLEGVLTDPNTHLPTPALAALVKFSGV